MSKALVVLSGGQDSTACLFMAIAKHGVQNVFAITFDYGQTHHIEIEAATRIAQIAGIGSQHEVVRIGDVLASTSPLVQGQGEDLKRYESFESMEAEVGDKVEKTFIPMRNTFFLTIAANRAVAMGCTHIYTGICQGDNANYPDCTEHFRLRLEWTFNQSLGNCDHTTPLDAEGSVPKQWLHVKAPLMYKSKSATCKDAFEMGDRSILSLAFSHTSYDGKYPPKDNNHANLLRAKGFEEAGLPDPLVVRAHQEGLMEFPDTVNYGPSAWSNIGMIKQLITQYQVEQM